jgi:diguanylate cyclase (GGDEF)-like protein
VQAIPDLIFRVDRAGNVLEDYGDARAGGERELPPGQYVGSTLEAALPDSVVPVARAQIERALDGGEVEIREYRLPMPTGDEDYESRIVRIGDDEVIAIIRNITARKTAQEELERARAQEQYLARHDPLTGLPNRRMFHDEVLRAVGRAERHGTQLGILFLDLDGFKAVNDDLGHEAGDELLRYVADRLLARVRKNDVVARLGGDEFTLAVEDVQGPQDMERLAEKVIEALSEPFRLGRGEARISASVGVCLYPQDGPDPDTLIRHADEAMYRAKRAGKARYLFYDR